MKKQVAVVIATVFFALVGCTTAIQKADQDYWAKDYQTAYAQFLPLAQGGDWLADERIAFMYAHGQGRDKDLSQAQHWYEKAALDGDVAVEYSLGADSLYASPGGPDYPQAAKWFQLAADQHDPDAELQLSVMYEHGLGVAKDEGTAVHWLDQYVAQTHVVGQKVSFKFSGSDGDNTGGFMAAVQKVMLAAYLHSPYAHKFSNSVVYLSFHYQDGRATDVQVVRPSGDPYVDSNTAKLLQDTLLPPVLPSLSRVPSFTMGFGLGAGLNELFVTPAALPAH